MHQNAFGGRAPPGSAGELMPSPDSQAAIRGPTSKREVEVEGGEEREGWGEEGKKGMGRGRHGKYISILDLSIDGLTV